MSGLGLYLISQDVNEGYETFDSAVVCAASEDDARGIHPNAAADVDKTSKREWASEIDAIARGHAGYTWSSPDKVKVEYIGQAANGVERGIVCASFNAG